MTVQQLIDDLQNRVAQDERVAKYLVLITQPCTNELRSPDVDYGYVDDGISRCSEWQPHMEEWRRGARVVLL